jgi:tRNA threonylcarbamoyladenosine biosynthesis protein TsaE
VTCEAVVTTSAVETEAVGEKVAASCASGDLVLLRGELAAGKTTLVRGLVRGLGGDPDEVSSPSFVLVQSYPCSGSSLRAVHHVDLYRLGKDRATLREIGLEELLCDDQAVVVVEWPKGPLLDWLPPDARGHSVTITIIDEDTRRIEITSCIAQQPTPP